MLCYLQLQAALVSCPANFASTDRQKPGHSSSSGALGPVRAGTGAGARGNVVGSPLSSRAALPRRGGTRGTAGLAPGGWDRSLPTGKELEKPVVGSGRASSCRSSFPSAAAVPAPLSALLGALEAGLRQASLCATEGSVAAPAGAKLSVPGLKGKPLPERKIKLIQKAGASSGAQGSPPGNRRRMKGPGSLVRACDSTRRAESACRSMRWAGFRSLQPQVRVRAARGPGQGKACERRAPRVLAPYIVSDSGLSCHLKPFAA